MLPLSLTSCSSLLPPSMCLIRYRQISILETRLPSLVIGAPPPPAYATGDCGNQQVFLNFHSKFLVLTQAIGDNQKCRSTQQADLLYVKSARCARPSLVRTENIERVFIFKNFFHNPTDNTLFCSMVKLRKLN